MAKSKFTAANLAARLRDAANLIELIERIDAGGQIEPRAPTVAPPAVPSPSPSVELGEATVSRRPTKHKQKRRPVKAAILAELRRDASRSNAEIAEVIGCHKDSVHAARRSLASAPAGDSAASSGDADDQEDSRQQRAVA